MTDDPRAFFAKHAKAYDQSASHAAGPDLAMLTALVDPNSQDRLLDVAAGTGHTALHLRPQVASATLVDLTPEMLAQARLAAVEKGLSVDTVVADAAAIPLPDGAFSVITCRRAAHHFPDVPAFLKEAYRLLSPGGRLAVADMTADTGAIALLNQMERLRDSSHVAALAPEAWRRELVQAGFDVLAVQLQEEPYTLMRWLQPVKPEDVDMAALQSLLAGATTAQCSALGIRQDASGWHLTKRRVVVLAGRPK
ncbi:MAG: class I SAM-dependent methyltransferase [Sulfobacillus sp.]